MNLFQLFNNNKYINKYNINYFFFYNHINKNGI